MAEFTPIVDLGTIDLTPEELDVGDTSAHVSKMNSLMTKIESWVSQFAATSAAMNALGQELTDAQYSDIAEINALTNLVTSLQSDIANVETVSGVDLVDLEAKADAIQAIIDTVTPLSTSNITGLDDVIKGLPGKLTPINALPGHGNFITAAVGDDWAENTGVFDSTEFERYFVGSNGTDFSTMTEVGRFYYNNTTNGGSAGSLNAVALAFATAMGIEASRYSPEWCVGQVTTGAGTAGDNYNGTHYNHCNTTNLTKLLGVHGHVSVAFWFRAPTQNAFVRGYAEGNIRQAYIDGVRVPETGGIVGDVDLHTITAGTVVHLAFSYKAPVTFQQSSAMYDLLTRSSQDVQYAAPVVYPGAFQIEPPSGIVRSALS